MTLPLSDSEFDRQFTTASRRGAARRQDQPVASPCIAARTGASRSG